MYFLIGLVRSTALYGIFCLLAGVFGFHISIETLLQSAFNPNGIESYFMAYMFWSPALLVIEEIVFFIWTKIDYFFFGSTKHNYFESLMGRFVVAFSNPWRGLTTLIGASKIIDCYDLGGLLWWIEVILHFLWSIALLGFIGLGFYNLIK